MPEKQEVKRDDPHTWRLCQGKALAAHAFRTDCETARSQKLETQSLAGDGIGNVKDRTGALTLICYYDTKVFAHRVYK